MKANNIEDIYPLSPMQQGILFHTLYAAEPGKYVIQIGWTLRGALDAAAFRGAWQDVVARHAALRTAFAWERLAEPVQIVWKRLKLAVEEQDLRGLDAAEQAARVRRFAEDDWQKGFDPTRAPLLRVALLRLADDAHRFVWTGRGRTPSTSAGCSSRTARGWRRSGGRSSPGSGRPRRSASTGRRTSSA